jgi:MOSC domain-containing protein YiiM
VTQPAADRSSEWPRTERGVMAHVVAVCLSEVRGVQKTPVDLIEVEVEHGVRGDAHAGDWHRQVSLLADESAEVMRQKGIDVGPGAFGENIVTEGIAIRELPIGARLRVGSEVLLEVTQIGKVCHDRCAIYYAAGDCIMPREGIFCRVLHPGSIKPGDSIDVVSNGAARSE